jgi:signal transduction histidine kinase
MTIQFAAEAEMKGITLAADVPADATVVSNRELILLVLQNLVGNAVKFSDCGTVRIGGEVDPGTGLASTLWVSDEGPGIAAEQLTHIFKAFGRAEAGGTTGVGLGLTVAAEAARLLGARLTVESRPSRGTTFYLAFAHNGHDRPEPNPQ